MYLKYLAKRKKKVISSLFPAIVEWPIYYLLYFHVVSISNVAWNVNCSFKGLHWIPMSLTQLVGIMHNICKVWGSNPGHHKKKNASIEIAFNLGQINWVCLEIHLSVSNVSLSQSTKYVFGSVRAYLHLAFKCHFTLVFTKLQTWALNWYAF